MQKSLYIFFALTVTSVVCSSANAIAPFKKAFDEKYVKTSDNDEFKAAFRKGSCNVCHVKGQKKDWLNGYGLALAKHLPGIVKERLDKAKEESSDASKAENVKLLEELKKAFGKAELEKIKAGDSYGTLLKEHKLPTEEGAKSLYAKDEDAADGTAKEADAK